jgi:hypothetical protein
MNCAFVINNSTETVTHFDYCDQPVVGEFEGNPFCEKHMPAVERSRKIRELIRTNPTL